jgi:hypothetical protein
MTSYGVGLGLASITDPVTGTTRFVAGFPFSRAIIPTTELAAALVTDDDDVLIPACAATAGLTPQLYTDADGFPAPSVAGTADTEELLPTLFGDDDTVFAPALVPGGRTLVATLVSAADVIYSPYATRIEEVPGGPQQKLKPPPKVQDLDTIYAARLSSTTSVVIDQDIIRAPLVTAHSVLLPSFVSDDGSLSAASVDLFSGLQPALLIGDDEVFVSLVSLVVLPEQLASDDDILAADVGWQVIAELTVDTDEFVYLPHAQMLNELLPEVYADELSVETYPFRVQQLTGGIPVKPREGTLKGSIKKAPTLVGSITTKRVA